MEGQIGEKKIEEIGGGTDRRQKNRQREEWRDR